MRFGVFSYVPAARDAAEAGSIIRGWGFDLVKIHRQRPDDCLDTPLTAERCRAIRRGYESNGVEVVAFAAYRDLATRDAERRAETRRQMREWLRWAPELGARYVCSEASIEGRMTPPPTGAASDARDEADEDRFVTLVDEVGFLEPCAREAGVVLALEPSASTPLDSVERALSLVRTIDSPSVRLIFDPANLMTADHLAWQREHVGRVLDALSPYVVLAHAKDFAYTVDGHYTPAAGTGLLDWTTIFGEMLRVGYDGPVILEHLTAEQVSASRAHLDDCLMRARK